MPILTNTLQSFNEIMRFVPINPKTNQPYTRAPVTVALQSAYKAGKVYSVEGICPISGCKCNVWALSNDDIKDDVVAEVTLYQTVMSKRWDSNIFSSRGSH